MDSYCNILGFNVLKFTYEEILTLIEKSIDEKKDIYVFSPNHHIILLLLKNESLLKEYVNFRYLLPDGIGLYFASKILYGKNGFKQRLTGTDLYFKILELSDAKKYRCFFYGGDKRSIELLPDLLKANYPNIILSGYNERDINYNDSMLQKINESKPDILFLGLGSPYQEEWFVRNKNKINVPVKIAVGSGIDFISGYRKRAPLFIQKIGLEWFFRFLQEPRRLWKRYFLGIPIFIFKVILFKIKLIRNKIL